MTDRPQSSTSSSRTNLPRHRSHSYREKPTRSNSHRQKIDHIQRRFDRELNQSERELQWVKKQRSDSFASSSDHLQNLRSKIQHGYNQLMQQKVEDVEAYMNQTYDEERRLSQRKFRKALIKNEKFRLQSINDILRERDVICEEKLAAQRSLYNRLLDEQARRSRTEKTLQSFENLNISQLKDRLTSVEHSNHELKYLIRHLIHRQPVHSSAVFIPHFPV